ncbi:uncharacterized protein LOC117571804 [Drosophila albomicans]|uniref:Uncharacterized protein LOC117571804 n=1 Tax=Drosophila albomicans TaxID=7291 RepID=A0A6P8X1U1_DROAB|nr:uncharacterized protein LOC117571804 [Drosophila albomicans]
MDMQDVEGEAVCPLGDCQKRLHPSDLLRHLLSEHMLETPGVRFGLKLRRVRSGERTLLPLVYEQLLEDQDQCLCVLNWACDDLMLTPQSNLPQTHRMLSHHLPILVMICKTTWRALFEKDDEKEDENEIGGNLYVIWLVAPATSRPILCQLGFLNREFKCGLRVMRQVRNFATRLHINKYLLGVDHDYLALSEQQLKQMCCRNECGCFLEVLILGDIN